MAGAGIHEGLRAGSQEISFLFQGFETGLGGQSFGQGVRRLDLGGDQGNQCAAVVKRNGHLAAAQRLDECHEGIIPGGYDALKEAGRIRQNPCRLGAAVKDQHGGRIRGNGPKGGPARGSRHYGLFFRNLSVQLGNGNGNARQEHSYYHNGCYSASFRHSMQS